MRFDMAKGLQICSRHNANKNMEASWTCCHTLDRTCIQYNWIIFWQIFAYRLLKCGMILPFLLVKTGRKKFGAWKIEKLNAQFGHVRN